MLLTSKRLSLSALYPTLRFDLLMYVLSDIISTCRTNLFCPIVDLGARLIVIRRIMLSLAEISIHKLLFELKLWYLDNFIAALQFPISLLLNCPSSNCDKSPKNNVALAWFKNNNEIIHFDPASGLLLEDKDSNKRTFNNSSARFSDLR